MPRFFKAVWPLQVIRNAKTQMEKKGEAATLDHMINRKDRKQIQVPSVSLRIASRCRRWIEVVVNCGP